MKAPSPSQLTRDELKSLLPYKRALPANEYAALESWLSTFWPFQRAWMLDRSRYSICNKSRQIGISHSTAGLLVMWMVFHGETTTVISEGEREAKEVLDKVKKHLGVLQALGSQMAIKVKDAAEEVGAASGGRTIALPQSAGRGFTGNVYLDEFAYYKRPDDVWDAAMAVTMLGFRGRVSSTPNGVGNHFYDLFTDPTKNRNWSLHEIPIQQAIDDGYPVDMDTCWTLAKGDPRIFDQLFNCKFLDGELQYIPSGLVNDCSVDKIELNGDGFYAGLDVGKEADKTVLLIVQVAGNKRRVVYVETRSRTDSDALDGMVDRAFQFYQVRRLCVDSTGLGSFPAQRMQQRHGYWSVEPVTFTLQSKEDLATSLYTAFSDRALVLPKTDAALPAPLDKSMPGNQPGCAEQLRHDVCSLQRIITSAGNVRYDAPRTDKGHADSAWALALAVHAAGQAQPRGVVPANVAAAF